MAHVTDPTISRRPTRQSAAAQPVATARTSTGGRLALRTLGAVSLIVMGSVHLEQDFSVHYRVIPVIGPLFALNFAGAVAVALLLLLPTGRNRVLGSLLALGGTAMAVTSFVFLFVSEHRRLFGFEEYGYRPAIVVALAAEAAAAVFLTGYLALLRRR